VVILCGMRSLLGELSHSSTSGWGPCEVQEIAYGQHLCVDLQFEMFVQWLA
jgi:hypothetical protein